MGPEPLPRPEIPHIGIGNLPEEHKDCAFTISGALNNLHEHAADFHVDLILFEAMASNWTAAREVIRQGYDAQALQAMQFYSRATLPPARDAVMAVYHFRRTIEGIQELLSQCPPLYDIVDLKRLQSARKWIEHAFPRIIDIRNAIGHAAARVKNQKAADRHSWKGDPSSLGLNIVGPMQLSLRGVVVGRQFTVTWKTEALTFEVSGKTLETLLSIRDEVYQAFGPADVHRRWRPKPDTQQGSQ